MGKDKIYKKRQAKKYLKNFIKIAKSNERLSNYDKALIFYKRAKNIAKIWNINKISSSLTFKITQLLILHLKNKLKEHLHIVNLSELNYEYNNAYEHTKIAIWIAIQLKKIGLDEMNPIIKRLKEKDKALKSQVSLRIFMRFNNGAFYETPTILSKALELIEVFPTSFEIPDNFILFENCFNQKIQFKHILKNSWYLEISLPYKYKFKNLLILKFKYLTTNIIKIFTLNFFRGYFIVDYLAKSENINNYYKQASSIIKRIRDVLENYYKCPFCNNQILRIGQINCEYCGTPINYNNLLFPNLWDA